MFFKLAVKNVRRSVKDYMVYFLTLLLAVCIFYMFNSIDQQMVLLQLQEENASQGATLVQAVGLLSFVISFVLAFLIIYANGFLMKRRKSEFGLYMTLGVSNAKIAGMLVLETFLIGVLALASGLAAGYFASQGMSVLTAAIFKVRITNYHFIFSRAALVKTCVYFAVIFVFVMLMNIASISRQSLAKLLASGKENQKVPVRHRWAAIALTVAGAAVIAGSYWMVFAMGFEAFMSAILPAIVVNFLGTLLFLFGLSGILMSGQHRSARYFKGLRMFSQRQLASRVNSNVLSMATICTMLFLTLVIVSSVASINSLMNREQDLEAPFDVSFTTFTEDWTQNPSVESVMAENGIDGSMFSESFSYPIYESPVTQGQICMKTDGYSNEVWERVAREQIDAIAVSDFNRVAEMQGMQPIDLAPGTFAIDCTLDIARQSLEPCITNPAPIDMAGTVISYSGLPLLRASLWTSTTQTMPLVLVLPDDIAASLAPPYLDVFIADYSGDAQVNSQILRMKKDAIASYEVTSPNGTVFRMALKSDVELNNRMVNATMTFIGLYIGMVFLIASAAILALQLLSGASDDRPRYELLRKLGTGQKMINGSMLSQVAVYFMLPLAIAAVHSIFGISYMSTGMGMVGMGDIVSGATLVALLIIAIYGLYFVVTYAACRRIINAKEMRRAE